MRAIDIQGIRRLLPHRYPFLLLDHVEHVEAGKSVIAIKNITANEPFFQGHFPEYPVFPGVLLVECIAQAAAILASETMGAEASQDTLYLLAGINRARFKRFAVPGDQLRITANIDRRSGKLWRCPGSIRVGESLTCEAEVLFTHKVLE